MPRVTIPEKLIMLERSTSEDGQLTVVPSSLVVTLWRNVISTIYMHPSLLVHPDMADLRSIFIENNVIHEHSEAEIFIPLPGLDKSNHTLRPQITFPNTALQVIFGQVLNFDIGEAGITIRNYRLCSTVKTAVAELAEFIRVHPRGLYGEDFGFVYDFLVRFGLAPRIIESLIPRHQASKYKIRPCTVSLRDCLKEGLSKTISKHSKQHSFLKKTSVKVNLSRGRNCTLKLNRVQNGIVKHVESSGSHCS